jgi:hypothetical protein
MISERLAINGRGTGYPAISAGLGSSASKISSAPRQDAPMEMIARYLEKAIDFEKMALNENNPTLKSALLKQATAYRNLAEERARKLNLPPPPQRPRAK